jgi:hypothetical protein
VSAGGARGTCECFLPGPRKQWVSMGWAIGVGQLGGFNGFALDLWPRPCRQGVPVGRAAMGPRGHGAKEACRPWLRNSHGNAGEAAGMPAELVHKVRTSGY